MEWKTTEKTQSVVRTFETLGEMEQTVGCKATSSPGRRGRGKDDRKGEVVRGLNKRPSRRGRREDRPGRKSGQPLERKGVNVEECGSYWNLESQGQRCVWNGSDVRDRDGYDRPESGMGRTPTRTSRPW